MLMGGTGSNPLETNEEANNDISTPDDLEEVESGENPAFFVAGDVLADDVDHFLMAIDGIDAERKISCSCSSARVGSGVQGLRLSIVDVAGDGELVSGTEADDANANCGEDGIDIPEGATELVLKIEGGGQSEAVTGTHYRCGVNFFSAE